MTAERFEVVLNEFDEVEYIMDKTMMEDRDFAEFMDFVETVCKENEQLKSFNQDLSENLSVCADKRLTQGEYLTKLNNENEQLKTTIQQLRTDNTKQKKLLNTTMKENEQLKCGNKNLKATLNDFINICNRLQANPTDKQTLGVARDMLQNMGVDLE